MKYKLVLHSELRADRFQAGTRTGEGSGPAHNRVGPGRLDSENPVSGLFGAELYSATLSILRVTHDNCILCIVKTLWVTLYANHDSSFLIILLYFG